MSHRLNLVWEVEALTRERQRDPLKLGMFVLGIVVFFCLAVFFIQWRIACSRTVERRSLDNKWARLEEQAAVANRRILELNEVIHVDSALMAATKNRFLWGPKLQVLFDAVPPAIQLENLSPTVTQDGALDSPRVFAVGIDGKAAGAVPRLAAEEFRQELIKRFSIGNMGAHAKFRRLEEPESPQGVMLGGATLGIASFSIALEVEEPAPVGREEK